MHSKENISLNPGNINNTQTISNKASTSNIDHEERHLEGPPHPHAEYNVKHNDNHSLSSFNKLGTSQEENKAQEEPLEQKSENKILADLTNMSDQYSSSYQDEFRIKCNTNSSYSIANEFDISRQEPQAQKVRRDRNLLITQDPRDLRPLMQNENQGEFLEVVRNLRWGNGKMLLGKYEQAEKDYKRILKKNPDCFEAVYNLGIVQYCQNKLDQAFEYFTKALQIEPHNSHLYVLLGQVYEKYKDFKKARLNYNKAVIEDNSNSIAYLLWGNSLAKSHRLKRAVAKYRKAIRAGFKGDMSSSADLSLKKEWCDPESPFELENDEEEEKEEISRTFESNEELLLDSIGESVLYDLNNRDVDMIMTVYLNMAQVWIIEGYYYGASQIYEKIISKCGEANKYKNAAYYGLSNLYMAKTEYDKAVEMRSKVLPRHVPKPVTEQINLNEEEEDRELARAEGKKGNDFIRKNDFEAARKAFQKSFEANKGGYLANLHLAKINMIDGNLDEAKKFLEEAHFVLPRVLRNLQLKTVPIECCLKTLSTEDFEKYNKVT